MFDGAVQVLERRRPAPMGDHGMVVSIVSWILLVVLVFALVTRFSMKMALAKKGNRFGLDDLFVVLAAVFSIGQTVAVSVEAVHALGQHVLDLTPSQVRIFEKTEYAACMLYIANMGCARISVCLLIKNILPGPTSRCTALVFAGLSFLWTVSGILVSAFRCQLPRPWDFAGNKCFDVIRFVNYVGVTNIVVEVLLIMIPLFVWNLRLTAGRRASVSSVFIARLSIVAAVAAQLTFFNRYSTSLDVTYDYWRTVLCVQIAQNLSVITACLPCLHPFILSILSGATKTESLVFECDAKRNIKHFLKNRNFKFDPMSSASSTAPMKEPDYCRPLATYGLDRSSAHLHSQHFNRFPANVATPIRGPTSPENVFNRSVEIPRSRPVTLASQNDLPPLPKTLSEVGVLPLIDWDTDGSDRDSGQSIPSRKRDSEYIFNREKVISVPEAGKLYEEGIWSRYPPSPPPGTK